MKKTLIYTSLLYCLAIAQNIQATITISSLSPDRWQEYKELRLQALENEPVAFTVAVEQEACLPDEYWQQKLERAQQNKGFWMLFAQENGKLIGMVGAEQEEHYTYSRHLATIISMYVAPEWRGKGVSSLLLHTLIEHLQKHNEVKVALLWVTQGQDAAIALYKKCGFTECGILQNSIIVNNRSFDMILMQRAL